MKHKQFKVFETFLKNKRKKAFTAMHLSKKYNEPEILIIPLSKIIFVKI